ncbi:hypothetical protein KFK09_026536 [Dendrobium nobile]|uniref:CCHC-type domain-containing protein n=1 Tax=Dendrobium nobile TaxID=94219 RepID=A0A8T3A737_DENNO|nr:hypothetical protein KFK09_026536 [Dendrobium nobile]
MGFPNLSKGDKNSSPLSCFKISTSNEAEAMDLAANYGEKGESSTRVEEVSKVTKNSSTDLLPTAEDNGFNDLEKVRICETGELGKCDKMNEEMPKRINPGNLPNAWLKKENIRVTDLNFGKSIAGDGKTVILDAEKVLQNSKKLEKALVVKTFGEDIPLSTISFELRRQWGHYGKFHLTVLGKGWFLCSFSESDQMEVVLTNGPWFINGNIVGEPYLIDGNMFQWSRREFSRICVRIDLDAKLPTGVWVDGRVNKFFQKIEYEKLPYLCFECGKIGHTKEECTAAKIKSRIVAENLVIPNESNKEKLEKAVNNQNLEVPGVVEKEDYDPRMLFKYGKKRSYNHANRNS